MLEAAICATEATSASGPPGERLQQHCKLSTSTFHSGETYSPIRTWAFCGYGSILPQSQQFGNRGLFARYLSLSPFTLHAPACSAASASAELICKTCTLYYTPRSTGIPVFRQAPSPPQKKDVASASDVCLVRGGSVLRNCSGFAGPHLRVSRVIPPDPENQRRAEKVNDHPPFLFHKTDSGERCS